MVLVSTATVVATAYLAPRTQRDQLVRFYERVRPPGFWHETAVAAGEDPASSRRALRQGLTSVVAAATTIYGLLVGIGLLVVRPDTWALPSILILTGILVAPIWIRRL